MPGAALSEELLGHAGGSSGGTDALSCRLFPEQLLTLETGVGSCSELCAPRAESESRETGKRPSTGPGGRWSRGIARVGPARREGWPGFLPAFYAEPLE